MNMKVSLCKEIVSQIFNFGVFTIANLMHMAQVMNDQYVS